LIKQRKILKKAEEDLGESLDRANERF
jgi:hypothetical protein